MSIPSCQKHSIVAIDDHSSREKHQKQHKHCTEHPEEVSRTLSPTPSSLKHIYSFGGLFSPLIFVCIMHCGLKNAYMWYSWLNEFNYKAWVNVIEGSFWKEKGFHRRFERTDTSDRMIHCPWSVHTVTIFMFKNVSIYIYLYVIDWGHGALNKIKSVLQRLGMCRQFLFYDCVCILVLRNGDSR